MAPGSSATTAPSASAPTSSKAATSPTPASPASERRSILILQLGVPAIFAHVNAILDALEHGLLERGFRSLRSADRRQRSCTLSVLPPAGVSPVELQRLLGARGVSCAVPDGLLRFTPHWPNDLGQVSDVLAAVDAELAR